MIRALRRPFLVASVMLPAVLLACSATPNGPGPLPPEPPEPPVQTAACPALPDGAVMDGTGTFDSRATTPVRRVVLMGGASEVDAASREFVEAAAGGDVLVLRASGSTTTYNSYFASGAGASPAPAWVGTIRLDVAAAGGHPAVLCRVGRAEAVWLAGGDQWNYLGQWPAVLHDSLRAAATRRVAIGGTSAGAMSLSDLAYDARSGSATSEQALADPFHASVTVMRSPFAQPELAGTLVDTHFMQRTREGRLLVFLARGRLLLQRDTIVGIGLDERAAIIIAGGRFTVRAGAADRYVWIYRVTGAATLQQATPLSLDGIERVRLENGATGDWPLDPDRWPTQQLRVVAGQVQPL
jgi:cyanophycinase